MRAMSITLLFCSAAMAVEPLQALSPPKIVAHSSAPTASSETPLAVGKFLWLTVQGYDGPILWDGAENPAVFIFNAKPGTEYPGIKEGESKYGSHKAPDGKNDVLMVHGVEKGVVSVTAFGVKESKPVKLATLVLSVSGARPPPEPQPQPIPAGKLANWVLIEETSQAWPTRGNDLAEAYAVSKTAGIKWTVADQNVIDPTTNQPPAALAKYIEVARSKGLPYLFLVTSEGDVIWSGPKPASIAAKLKEYK